MAEGNKPFVVTDRRKFTMEGEVRPDAERRPEPEVEVRSTVAAPVAAAEGLPPVAQTEVREEALPEAGRVDLGVVDQGGPEGDDMDGRQELPPAPTAEQTERSRVAYEQTTDRLDTAIRAANPGGEHARPMDFVQMVQSFYMTAILQLGGATQEGQQPQIDLMGARQSIDMLGVLAERTMGNLSADEGRLLESALFDARMAFLEITQAIARQAQQTAAAKGGPGSLGGAGFGSSSGPGGTMGIVR